MHTDLLVTKRLEKVETQIADLQMDMAQMQMDITTINEKVADDVIAKLMEKFSKQWEITEITASLSTKSEIGITVCSSGY